MICQLCDQNTSIPKRDWISGTYCLQKLIPKDVIHHIAKWITYPQGHKISWTCKSRHCPEHMDYDSEDEMMGYYWNEHKTICTTCFMRCFGDIIQKQNILPYLRIHAAYFYKDSKSWNECDAQMLLRKVLLPTHYVIDYYNNHKISMLPNKYGISQLISLNTNYGH